MIAALKGTKNPGPSLPCLRLSKGEMGTGDSRDAPGAHDLASG